jgi:hypothetical protein
MSGLEIQIGQCPQQIGPRGPVSSGITRGVEQIRG